MKPGTRVVIKSPAHPWYSHSGIISKKPALPTGQLIIELDNGMNAGAYPRELKQA